MKEPLEAIIYPADKEGPSMGQKFMRWVKQNPDTIVVGGVITLIVGFSIWAVIADSKAMQLEAKEYDEYLKNLSEWIRQENGLGKSVYQLMDGSYISVPASEIAQGGATAVTNVMASAA